MARKSSRRLWLRKDVNVRQGGQSLVDCPGPREEGGHGGTAGLPVLGARSWCVGGGRRVLQLWPNLARRPRAAFGCGRVCYNGGLTGHEARDWQEPRQGYGDDRRRDHDGYLSCLFLALVISFRRSCTHRTAHDHARK